jgi:polyisoprenoid-binding protein YceI
LTADCCGAESSRQAGSKDRLLTRKTFAISVSDTLRVIDKGESEKDRAEVQKTMLGPEVLDSERHHEIVFKSVGAESVGQGQWKLRGNLTLRGQSRPIAVHVTLKDGRYTGEATVKQTDFGIKPPGKAGVRAKDEVRIEFDVRLAS